MAQRFNFGIPGPRSRDGWFKLGNIDVTTTAFLVGSGIISMFLYAVSIEWFAKLVFHPSAVRQFEIWRLVTWPIATPPTSAWVLITLFFFWYFGHIVEEMVGRIRFTRLIAAITVAPTLFVSIIGDLPTAAEMGLGLLGTVMLAIFAAENPDAPFFFGIPAWIIASIFVGIDILRFVGDRIWGSLLVMLLAIGTALVTVRQWGFADRLDMIPRFTNNTRHKKPTRSSRGKVRRPNRSRGGSQVVRGPWEPPAASPATQALQDELDDLLDKVSSRGLDALSSDEKKRLNELSKRLR